MTNSERPFARNGKSTFEAELPERQLPKNINLICGVHNYAYYEPFCEITYAVLGHYQKEYFSNTSLSLINNRPQQLSSFFRQLCSDKDSRIDLTTVSTHFNNPKFPYYSTDKTSIIITDSLLINTESLQSRDSPIAVSEDNRLIIVSFNGIEAKRESSKSEKEKLSLALELAVRSFVYACGFQESLQLPKTYPYLFKFNCQSGNCVLSEHNKLIRPMRIESLCASCESKLKKITMTKKR